MTAEAFRYSAPPGGGMTEEMYARVALAFPVFGPGSGVIVATPWSAPSLDTYGSLPPTIQAAPYDYELRVNAIGYHLVSLLANHDGLAAGDSLLIQLTQGPNSIQPLSLTLPVLGNAAMDAANDIGPVTAAMHLVGAPGPFTDVTTATLRANLSYDVAAAHTLAVIVGLSRIGTSVAGDPPTVV